MEVLVKAGANTEAGLRLARTKGKDKVLKYLGHNNIRCEEGIKAEIIRKSDELEALKLKERKELEAKKKEKKKLLDRAKTSLRTETEMMERELAMLEMRSVELTGELARHKKEGQKKIQSLTLELNDLNQDLNWKLAGGVKGEDVAKCLECPICLDLCQPPKEVSSSPPFDNFI